MNLLNELQNLNDKTLLLASTERVARHLKLEAALIKSVDGQKAWFTKGVITTVSSWIESSWLDLMPDQQLLYPVQELAVVKSMADRSGLLPSTLISSTSTARRISQAYSLMHKYQIPLDQDRFKFKREFEVFWQWREKIAEDSAKNGYVFRAELPALLLKAVEDGLIVIPERVVIVGIMSMNPAERSVFDALISRGATVVEYAEPENKSTPSLIRTNTQADEFAKVATWVNDTLMPHAQAPHGAPSVAILVPEMRNYQMPMLEALTLAVSPASLMPPVDGVEAREPWDISSGATLGARPMIRAAMDILALTSYRADFETFSRVLRSRWVGGSSQESGNRALMDVWLRENSGLSMTGKDFRRALTKNTHAECQNFLARFGSVLDGQQAITGSLYPTEWADVFAQSLKLMGWPETRELSSANYQTLNAWEEALAMFRTLDYQLGPCEYERAQMWLREIVDTKQFQPRISHVAPIRVMSYEDAIGLTFDHVWIVGASNAVLPLRADPNPFIATDLQAECGVPEASSELALAKARKVVSALLGVSRNLIVSCPSHDDKGSSVGASELFGQWPKLESSQDGRGGFVQSQINLLDRTQFGPEVVPAVSPEELLKIKGGVSVFKDYANGPFFAFAKNRLGAKEFPTLLVGLDPRIQGTMLHLVLEYFWTDVRTSQALKAMSSDALYQVVSAKVHEASGKLLNKLVWRYGTRLIGLEQKRLVALGVEWLAFESTRQYDFEVLGFEERVDIVVGDVPLTISLDRRDRVFISPTESRVILIDYKSGTSTRLAGLNAGSMFEPQLPIYATQIDPKQLGVEKIDGVALAQVNAANIGFHTRSDFSAHLIERKPRKGDVDNPTAWAEQCLEWDIELRAMSDGFIAGFAEIEDSEKALPMGYEFIGQLIR